MARRKVNTVLGPIEAEQLGRTLMHEHLQYGFTGWQGDLTLGPVRELYTIQENMKWIKPITEAPYNFGTIVDATNNECGRDPMFLARMSLALGINIICSTLLREHVSSWILEILRRRKEPRRSSYGAVNDRRIREWYPWYRRY